MLHWDRMDPQEGLKDSEILQQCPESPDPQMVYIAVSSEKPGDYGAHDSLSLPRTWFPLTTISQNVLNEDLASTGALHGPSTDTCQDLTGKLRQYPVGRSSRSCYRRTHLASMVICTNTAARLGLKVQDLLSGGTSVVSPHLMQRVGSGLGDSRN